jgi:hypothetical protein
MHTEGMPLLAPWLSMHSLHSMAEPLYTACLLTRVLRLCCAPRTAVLDDSANALFMTEIVRGMAYTIKAFFEPKVTVSGSST